MKLKLRLSLLFITSISFAYTAQADLNSELKDMGARIKIYTDKAKNNNNNLVIIRNQRTQGDIGEAQKKKSELTKENEKISKERDKFQTLVEKNETEFNKIRDVFKESELANSEAAKKHAAAVDANQKNPNRTTAQEVERASRAMADAKAKFTTTRLSFYGASSDFNTAKRNLKTSEEALQQVANELAKLDTELEDTKDFAGSITDRVAAAEGRKRVKEINELAAKLKSQIFDTKDLFTDFEILNEKNKLNQLEARVIKDGILARKDNTLFCEKVDHCQDSRPTRQKQIDSERDLLKNGSFGGPGAPVRTAE